MYKTKVVVDGITVLAHEHEHFEVELVTKCTLNYEGGAVHAVVPFVTKDKLEVITEEILVKPPMGIKPRELVLEDRLKEINEAACRFREANKEIPKEWIEEALKIGIELDVECNLEVKHYAFDEARQGCKVFGQRYRRYSDGKATDSILEKDSEGNVAINVDGINAEVKEFLISIGIEGAEITWVKIG